MEIWRFRLEFVAVRRKQTRFFDWNASDIGRFQRYLSNADQRLLQHARILQEFRITLLVELPHDVDKVEHVLADAIGQQSRRLGLDRAVAERKGSKQRGRNQQITRTRAQQINAVRIGRQI